MPFQEEEEYGKGQGCDAESQMPVTDVTSQRPLATEWRIYYRELEKGGEQLEVDDNHSREVTRVCTPVSQCKERRNRELRRYQRGMRTKKCCLPFQ